MGSSGSCMRMKAARRWGARGWYRYRQMKMPEPTRKANGSTSVNTTPTAISPASPVNRPAWPGRTTSAFEHDHDCSIQ